MGLGLCLIELCLTFKGNPLPLLYSRILVALCMGSIFLSSAPLVERLISQLNNFILSAWLDYHRLHDKIAWKPCKFLIISTIPPSLTLSLESRGMILLAIDMYSLCTVQYALNWSCCNMSVLYQITTMCNIAANRSVITTTPLLYKEHCPITCVDGEYIFCYYSIPVHNNSLNEKGFI